MLMHWKGFSKQLINASFYLVKKYLKISDANIIQNSRFSLRVHRNYLHSRLFSVIVDTSYCYIVKQN